MDKSGKLLLGAALKIFYQPDVIKSFKEGLQNSANVGITQQAGQMIATLVMKAVAEVKQQGANPKNEEIVGVIKAVIKEVIDMLGELGEGEDKEIAQGMLAATVKAVADMGKPPQPQGGQGGQQPMPAQQPQQPQQGGMIAQAMGGM